MKKIFLLITIFFALLIHLHLPLTLHAQKSIDLNILQLSNNQKNEGKIVEIAKQKGNPLAALIIRVINFLIISIGSLSMLLLIIGGSYLVISSGNENLKTKGSEILKWAIIGLIITLSSYFIVATVQNLFFETAQANSTPICQQANPSKQNTDSTYNIIVVNEEPIDAKSNYDPSKGTILNCIRKTTCTNQATTVGNSNPNSVGNDSTSGGTASTNSRTCTSEYVNLNNCTPNTNNNDETFCSPVQIYFAKSGEDLLYLYLGQIYTYMATIGALFCSLMIVIGGIMYSTSGGNNENIEKGKTLITRSLTGLIVLFSTSIILYMINPNFFTFG